MILDTLEFKLSFYYLNFTLYSSKISYLIYIITCLTYTYHLSSSIPTISVSFLLSTSLPQHSSVCSNTPTILSSNACQSPSTWTLTITLPTLYFISPYPSFCPLFHSIDHYTSDSLHITTSSISLTSLYTISHFLPSIDSLIPLSITYSITLLYESFPIPSTLIMHDPLSISDHQPILYMCLSSSDSSKFHLLIYESIPSFQYSLYSIELFYYFINYSLFLNNSISSHITLFRLSNCLLLRYLFYSLYSILIGLTSISIQFL